MDVAAIRLPAGLVEQADALIEPMAADGRLAAHGTVTRAVVLRLALARGLEALAAEYGAAPKAGPTRKRGAARKK